MGERSEQDDAETRADRRRELIVLFVVLGLFVLVDAMYLFDLFRNGTAEDLDHASERIGDLSSGPNAP